MTDEPPQVPAHLREEIHRRFDAHQTVQRIAIDLELPIEGVFHALDIPRDDAIPAEDVHWVILFPEDAPAELRRTTGGDGSPDHGLPSDDAEHGHG